MDAGKVIGQIIARLRDQRFLFLVAVIIALAVLAPLDVISDLGVMIVFGISAAVVLTDRLLEFLEARFRKVDIYSGRLNLRVALEFEGITEDVPPRLERTATYTIQNPHNPEPGEVREVLLHEGPGGIGWLCPLPSEAGPNDMISFTFTSVDGRQWNLTVMPDLLWPKERASRIS
jgi:hypothetical protein